MAIARKTLLTLVCLLGMGSAFSAVPQSRIYDGEDAATGQFPWVVSVRLDNVHVGVGSIITERYIITTGHFVSDIGSTSVNANRVSVRVGSTNQFSGGQIVRVRSITIHPSYGNFLHDVAILELDTALVWSDRIQKIDLVKEDPAEGASVIVTGWGQLLSGESPYKLQHTTMNVLSAPECELQAGYGYDSVLCLAHDVQKGVCRGDDGAGVVLNGKIVGVISFAFGSCGTKYPDVASSINYYNDWISSVIGQ